MREAVHGLSAAAAVYLLTADGTELRAAMIGGSPPAVHTLPGRMVPDSFYASARALAEGRGGRALAGQPAPFVRLPDGTVRTLRAPIHVPLGLPAETPYRAREHPFLAAAVLMLYSDGLPTADHTGALLETAGREAGADLEALADRLLGDAPGPYRWRDDTALLLARYEGADDAEGPGLGTCTSSGGICCRVGKARGFVCDTGCAAGAWRTWRRTSSSSPRRS